MVARTSREVLRWHESLYLTYPIVVPKWCVALLFKALEILFAKNKHHTLQVLHQTLEECVFVDLCSGFTYAEILRNHFPNEINMLNFINGRSLNSRLLNWAVIKQFIKKKNLPIDNALIDATLHGKDEGAEGLLEQTYQLLTNKKPFTDASYERDSQFTDLTYERTLGYVQRSHTSKSIKNNLKISELITDPSYAHHAKRNEMIRDQLKLDREKMRADNPRRFDIKPSLAERCLRKPLETESNPQDWYMRSFISRSRSATVTPNKASSVKQSSRQASADRSKQSSKLQFHREKGIIETNEDETSYKEILLKQHSIPLSDLMHTDDS